MRSMTHFYWQSAQGTQCSTSQPISSIADVASSALNESDGTSQPSSVLKSLLEAVDALLQVT